MPRRQRIWPRDRLPVEGKVVVDEGRLAIAEIQAVAADQPALGHDHPVGTAIGHVDVGGERPGLVQDTWRGVGGQPDLARVVGEGRRVAGQHRPAHGLGVQPLHRPAIERQHVVARRLGPPEILKLAQLLRILGRDVMRLRKVLFAILEFPHLRVGMEFAADRNPGREGRCRGHPAILMHAAVAEQLEVLLGPVLGRAGVEQRVGEARALDLLLRPTTRGSG